MLAVEAMEREEEKREEEMKKKQWIERCKLMLRESRQRKLLEQGMSLASSKPSQPPRQ